MIILRGFSIFIFFGITFANVSNRIAGGSVALPKQIPYQVGLRMISGKYYWPFCGGTLISNRHILTAAQCLKRVELTEVILGDINRKAKFNNERKVIKVYKRNFVIHERYNERELLNDIAIIKLPFPIEVTEFIKPAVLPKMYDNDYEGVTATASGWGYSFDEKKLTNILRFINVQIIANSVCSIYYKGIVLPSNICADFYSNKTTCIGDTGGPLVWFERNMTLIGITSFGTLFCERDYPPVFTRITSYLEWINDNLSEFK